MKKQRNVILAIVLAIALTAAGCSNNNNAPSASPSATGNTEATASATGSADNQAAADPNLTEAGNPIVKEKITLKVMGINYAIVGPWDKLKAYTDAEALTNIHIEFDMTEGDNFTTKKNLALASGDLPDIFYNGDITSFEEITYGGQGVLVPLEGYIDQYAPNLADIFKDLPELKASLTAADGHIYSLPFINLAESHATYGPRLYPNVPLLEKYGIDAVPETTDELYAALSALKKADSSTFPLTGTNLAEVRTPLLGAFGLIEDNNGLMVDNDKVMFVPIQDNYKAYLEYTNKLYSENLLDHEIFTHTPQEYIAKGKADKLGFFTTTGPHGYLNLPPDDMVAMKYPVVPPLTSPSNDRKIWPIVTNGIQPGVFAITASNKYPEASMRWADFWYSTQGTMLYSCGILMTQEQMDDPNYKTGCLELVPKDEADIITYFYGKLTAQKGPAYGSDELQKYIIQDNPIHAYTTEESVKIQGPYAQMAFPQVSLTVDESQRVAALLTDINTYKDQMEAKFVAGQEPLSNWDNYVNTLAKMKVDEVVQIYQSAYDRWKASQQ